MKLNLLQWFGAFGSVVGAILLGIYTQPKLPEFNYNGQIITFHPIPTWVPGATLVIGLGLVVLGTIVQMARRRSGEFEEEETEAEE